MIQFEAEKKMIVKVSLFMFILFQYLQFDVCQANGGDKGSMVILSPSLSRKPRHRTGYREFQCGNGRKKCGPLLLYWRWLRNGKRICCRKHYKVCRRKAFKKCSTERCYRRLVKRKCDKQFRKCNRRRLTDRRFMQRCGIFKLLEKLKKKIQEEIPEKKKTRETCRTNEECEAGLCCARHNHLKICKPLIQQDQVCTKTFFTRKRSPEMFERCPCAGGLVCSPSASRHNTCQPAT